MSGARLVRTDGSQDPDHACFGDNLSVACRLVQARHPHIWQTTVSLLPTSVRADSDRPTQRPASSGVQITVSATGVLQLPDHVCGTQ